MHVLIVLVDLPNLLSGTVHAKPERLSVGFWVQFPSKLNNIIVSVSSVCILWDQLSDKQGDLLSVKLISRPYFSNER